MRGTGAAALTRERVVETAAELAAEHGVEALSMRMLAERCGVATMTLYRHVATKDELLSLLADRAFEALELPPEDLPWPETLRAICRGVREILLAQPALAEIVARRHVNVTTAYRGAEAMLRALHAAGLDAEQAVGAFTALTTYTVGFAGQEIHAAERSAQLGERLLAVRSLPDDFTHVRGSVDVFLQRDSRRNFEMGLDLMIRGIGA